MQARSAVFQYTFLIFAPRMMIQNPTTTLSQTDNSRGKVELFKETVAAK